MFTPWLNDDQGQKVAAGFSHVSFAQSGQRRRSTRSKSQRSTVRRSKRCNSLHFDEKGFVYKTIRYDQRVRGIFAVWKHLREFAEAEISEFGNILRMDEISCELDDIRPRSTG